MEFLAPQLAEKKPASLYEVFVLVLVVRVL